MDPTGTDTKVAAARLLPEIGHSARYGQRLLLTLRGYAPVPGQIPDPDFPDSFAGLMGETHVGLYRAINMIQCSRTREANDIRACILNGHEYRVDDSGKRVLTGVTD
jgi:hypothetical protein